MTHRCTGLATPGPWRIVTRGGAVREIVADSTSRLVKDLATCWPTNGDPSNIAANDANACLMAAAPDLLEALKTARRVLVVACTDPDRAEPPYIREAFAVIDPAIAKAEGA